MSHLAAVQSVQDSDGIQSSGTPKSLEEAIERGLFEIKHLAKGGAPVSVDTGTAIIHRHVRDFLSQRFSVAMLSVQPAEELWHDIFPGERRGSDVQ